MGRRRGRVAWRHLPTEIPARNTKLINVRAVSCCGTCDRCSGTDNRTGHGSRSPTVDHEVADRAAPPLQPGPLLPAGAAEPAILLARDPQPRPSRGPSRGPGEPCGDRHPGTGDRARHGSRTRTADHRPWSAVRARGRHPHRVTRTVKRIWENGRCDSSCAWANPVVSRAATPWTPRPACPARCTSSRGMAPGASCPPPGRDANGPGGRVTGCRR